MTGIQVVDYSHQNQHLCIASAEVVVRTNCCKPAVVAVEIDPDFGKLLLVAEILLAAQIVAAV